MNVNASCLTGFSSLLVDTSNSTKQHPPTIHCSYRDYREHTHTSIPNIHSFEIASKISHASKSSSSAPVPLIITNTKANTIRTLSLCSNAFSPAKYHIHNTFGEKRKKEVFAECVMWPHSIIVWESSSEQHSHFKLWSNMLNILQCCDWVLIILWCYCFLNLFIYKQVII